VLIREIRLFFEAVTHGLNGVPEAPENCEDGSPDPADRVVKYPDGYGQTALKLSITGEIQIERPGGPIENSPE